MEGRNKPQSTDTHNKHDNTLPTIQTSSIAAIWRWTPCCIQTLWEFATDKIGRNDPCQKRRQSQICREASSRHSSITPQDQTYRVTDDGETATAACRKYNGSTHIHALSRVLQDVMHNNQHHRCCRQVVEVCREDKSHSGNAPQQTFAVSCTNPFGDEVETAIVAKQLYNRHRSQQEQDDSGCPADILQEYVVVDEPLHDIAGMFVTTQPFDILLRMLGHHEVCTPADIDHPTYRSEEHSDSGFVYSCQMACCYQQIGQEKHGDNNECHSKLRIENYFFSSGTV